MRIITSFPGSLLKNMSNEVVQAERVWYFSHVSSVKGREGVVRSYLHVGVGSDSEQQEESSCTQ